MDLKLQTEALGESALARSTQMKKNGSGGDFGALLKVAETKQSEAAKALEDYVNMTPAQRMQAAIMKSLGITQDQFDAMSPEEQAGVTAKIAEIMRQQMDQAAQKQQKSSSI